MKRTHQIACILTGILLLGASCQLDETLIDTPTPDQIKSEADVTTVINGLYNQFNNTEAFKFQGMIMLLATADDLYSPKNNEFGIYGNKLYTPIDTNPFWRSLNSTIANANNLIQLLDDKQFSSEFEKRAYGEAYFIRAFCYYYLVRLYGGIPIRTEPIDINSNFYLQRNTVDEVYMQIFTDFKAASLNLPLFSAIASDDLGRASKGAAQALMAEASLTYGNMLSLKGQNPADHYVNARIYADSVISSGQYVLLNNYGDLFDLTKEAGAYKEVIFGIRFQVDQQARSGPSAGSEFASRFGVGATHMVSGDETNGSGDGSLLVNPWFIDFYRAGDYKSGTGNATVYDYRMEKTYNPRGVNKNTAKVSVTYPNLPEDTEGTIPNALIGKYIDPNGKDNRNNGNDLFIIRLADMYLIKAEALNELNASPTADALSAFNEVRARARKANGIARIVPANLTLTPDLTQSQFRLKIFEERGAEFTGEGKRWFDLVRMKSPVNPLETMFEYQFFTVLPAKTQVLPVFKPANNRWSTTDAVYGPSIRNVTRKHLLFPVPTLELTQNKNFGPQNPGW